MELSLPIIFFLLISFAVGTAIIMFMVSQWLDLTGLRYKMESQRNAINLLQLIVSTSPIVHRDPYFEPSKIILDADQLEKYDGFDMYDQANFGDEWYECCMFPDYDYEINVIDLSPGGSTWHISPIPPFKTNSECYPKRIKSYVDMPVVIYKEGEYHPGFINITLTKTPLSDLTSWLSQALVRASWDSYEKLFSGEEGGTEAEFEIKVRLDPEIESGEIDSSGILCLTFRESISEGDPPPTYCKQFQTTDAGLTNEKEPPIQNPTTSCHDVNIAIYPKSNEVVVS